MKIYESLWSLKVDDLSHTLACSDIQQSAFMQSLHAWIWSDLKSISNIACETKDSNSSACLKTIKKTQNYEAFPKLCHLKGRKQKESQSLDLQQFLRFVIHHHHCNSNITHDISWHIKAIQKMSETSCSSWLIRNGNGPVFCSDHPEHHPDALATCKAEWSRIAQTNAAAPFFCYPLITNKELHGASVQDQ